MAKGTPTKKGQTLSGGSFGQTVKKPLEHTIRKGASKKGMMPMKGGC